MYKWSSIKVGPYKHMYIILFLWPLVGSGYSWQHTNQTPHCFLSCTRLTQSPWCSPRGRRCRSPIRCRSGTGSWSELAILPPQCRSASHRAASCTRHASYEPSTRCWNSKHFKFIKSKKWKCYQTWVPQRIVKFNKIVWSIVWHLSLYWQYLIHATVAKYFNLINF